MSLPTSLRNELHCIMYNPKYSKLITIIQNSLANSNNFHMIRITDNADHIKAVYTQKEGLRLLFALTLFP